MLKPSHEGWSGKVALGLSQALGRQGLNRFFLDFLCMGSFRPRCSHPLRFLLPSSSALGADAAAAAGQPSPAGAHEASCHPPKPSCPRHPSSIGAGGGPTPTPDQEPGPLPSSPARLKLGTKAGSERFPNLSSPPPHIPTPPPPASRAVGTSPEASLALSSNP